MDLDNPVVRLCGEGMRAEVEGRPDDARALFTQAWEQASDDYEACVAAHYLARHQPTVADRLYWNRVCLQRADAVGDERVAAFYPSLHVALAHCHRELGNIDAAARHFRHAADHLDALPTGPYGEWLRYTVAEGLRDTGALVRTPGEERLAQLLESLCERKDLRSLALLLPAFVGNLGTPSDHERLAQAAQQLHAEQRLSPQEQEALRHAVAALP